MALRKFKPTSAGRRAASGSDFAEITTSTPEKKLLSGIHKSGGRNNNGRITSRFRGGGHKRRYRTIDFKRNKIGVPAVVAEIAICLSFCACASASASISSKSGSGSSSAPFALGDDAAVARTRAFSSSIAFLVASASLSAVTPSAKAFASSSLLLERDRLLPAVLFPPMMVVCAMSGSKPQYCCLI